MKYLKQIIRLGILTFLSVSVLTTVSNAQERGNDSARLSPNASVSQTIGTTVVSITYGRPGIKDRTYFAQNSDLAPLGTWWRTGANESTVITFSDNVMIGGTQVDAGTYSLYTVPGKDEWTIIINDKLSWGTQYDSAEDYARIQTDAVTNTASMMEWFTIYFDNLSETGAHMNLHWGSTKVAVPITTTDTGM